MEAGERRRVLAESCGPAMGHIESVVHAIEQLSKLLGDFGQSEGNGQEGPLYQISFDQPCFLLPLDASGGDLTFIRNFLMRELLRDGNRVDHAAMDCFAR
jgi:hypothetical protein